MRGMHTISLHIHQNQGCSIRSQGGIMRPIVWCCLDRSSRLRRSSKRERRASVSLKNTDDGPVDVLYTQSEETIVLVLAGQHPATPIGLPYTVRYPLSCTPFGDMLFCGCHGFVSHADLRGLGRRLARGIILWRVGRKVVWR